MKNVLFALRGTMAVYAARFPLIVFTACFRANFVIHSIIFTVSTAFITIVFVFGNTAIIICRTRITAISAFFLGNAKISAIIAF